MLPAETVIYEADVARSNTPIQGIGREHRWQAYVQTLKEQRADIQLQPWHISTLFVCFDRRRSEDKSYRACKRMIAQRGGRKILQIAYRNGYSESKIQNSCT